MPTAMSSRSIFSTEDTYAVRKQNFNFPVQIEAHRPAVCRIYNVLDFVRRSVHH